jgi:integrase
MPHIRNKLTVKAVNSRPKGAYGDGGGLWLRKTSQTNGQWVFRYRLHNMAKQKGLGSIHKVSLAKARQRRDVYQEMVTDGLDPVTEDRRSKQKAREELMTMSQVAESAYESRKASLRGDGKAGRWFSPIKLHVLPYLGDRPIIHVGSKDIRDTLLPIWYDKADTARKSINRLNIIFEHAAALELDVDMQAVTKAKALLGEQRHTPTNIPAMPWPDVPDFYSSLNEQTPVQLALKFLILTPGARSKPVRFLHTDHIEGDVWTVPDSLMKGAKGKVKDWSTPLTQESLNILEATKPYQRNGYVFPNASGRGVISDASMARLMERRGLDYRPHGFRSSFRTWAAETNKRNDIAELCMAHKIHGSVEAAYLRTDYLNERRKVMQAWSDKVTGAAK